MKIKKCKYCTTENNKSLIDSKKGILPCCTEHYELYKQEINEKRKRTNIKNFGVEFPGQIEAGKKKYKETCLTKYGVDSANKVDNVKEKKKQTSLVNYGVEYYIQSKEGKNTIKRTNLEKYGVENTFQSEICKAKIKQTNLERYGVENPNKSKDIRKKIKQTNLERYGVETPFQAEIYKTKIKQTNLERYGSENPNDNPIILLKRMKSKKNNYWNTFIIQLKTKYIIPLFEKEYYIDNNENFKFKCSKCNNEFISNETNSQKIHCINCDTNKSLPEYEIENWLKSLNLNLTIDRNTWITFNVENVKRREIDILVDGKVAIFYHGLYWHSDLYKDKKFHQELFNLSKEKEYISIQIFENEWKNKQEIVKSIILSKLNINQTKVYARKTIIKEIDNNQYREFLEQNHIQGYGIAKTKLGMFLDDILISVLGVGRSRFKKDETEIIRYCSLLNYQIIGGLAKFLSHIKNNYNFENIISYIDLRYFDGGSYLNNGFKLESISNPNYFYFKNSGTERFMLYNRIQFQKHKLKDKLEKFDEKLTEYENMLNNDYLRIFDAGNYKLKLEN